MLFGATAVLAFYTYGLFRETKTLAEDATRTANKTARQTSRAIRAQARAAKAMERVADANHRMLVASHPPKLQLFSVAFEHEFVPDAVASDPPVLVYWVENDGMTVATITMTVMYERLPSENRQGRLAKILDVNGKSIVRQTVVRRKGVECRHVCSEITLADISDPESPMLELKGYISYTDEVGNSGGYDIQMRYNRLTKRFESVPEDQRD